MAFRRSQATPEPRIIGPDAPSTFASSGSRRPMPIVRERQIGFMVRRSSYSSMCPGIVWVKSSSIWRKRVVAVRDHHALLPAQRLHLLLDPGVEVADDRLDAAHLLAVQVDDQPQHAVRGRVMRPEVDGEQLAAEGAMLAGLGDRYALRGAHASGGGVSQVSCSSENSTTSPPTG